MDSEIIYPVILSGGTGSRLWPLSRASFPKQYLSFNSDEPASFFQKTVNRVSNLKNISDPIIICNEDHRFIVAEQMRNINVNPKTILLEPCGRNTTPAITIAAIKALKDGNDPTLLVLPADHIIKNHEKFLEVISTALVHVDKGKLVTLGIIPDRAETGFGYIEASKTLNMNDLKGEKIKRFIEKPNKKVAENLILDKRFSWNSGMFLFKASALIEEVKKFKPEIFKLCEQSLKGSVLDLDFQRIDNKYFSLCENISIDKAIMEKTQRGMVLPLDVGWNDIGSWQSMWEVSDKDVNGNVISGNVLLENVQNSYLRSEQRIIVGMGLEDTIVVDTVDAILIANKSQTQNVKDIVKKLQLSGKNEANMHKTIFRPWGNYTSMASGSNWQVKTITVNPGQSLSLQLHNHRTEHWIILNGKALVQINDKEKILKENESTYIPLASRHRLSNPGKEPLILIEVQSGDYLGEDDIVRFEDIYGRNTNK